MIVVTVFLSIPNQTVDSILTKWNSILLQIEGKIVTTIISFNLKGNACNYIERAIYCFQWPINSHKIAPVRGGVVHRLIKKTIRLITVRDTNVSQLHERPPETPHTIPALSYC